MSDLDESNPLHNKMLDLIMKRPADVQPDIFIHVTVPNEFNPMGKCNIGITAGIETTMVAPEWLGAGNRMTVLIMPSNHSKNIHESSQYDLKQSEDGPIVKQLRNDRPIEVLFEGVDVNIYRPLGAGRIASENDELAPLYGIEEDFCFLSVGHILQGSYRQDRKDIGGTISNFLDAFTYKKGKVALIMKCSGANFSLLDRIDVENLIKDVRQKHPDIDQQPNIYLVHGNLTDNEMNELYNLEKVKALISTTHGEGYGRPLAEFAAATGKPVLATGWSGQMDFLSIGGKELLFAFDMKEVHESAVWDKVILKGSQWAYVEDIDVVRKLNKTYHNYDEMLKYGKRVQQHIIKQKNFELMKKQLIEIIDKYYKQTIPQEIILPANINIPKLKRLSRK